MKEFLERTISVLLALKAARILFSTTSGTAFIAQPAMRSAATMSTEHEASC